MTDQPRRWWVLLHTPADPAGDVFSAPRFALHVEFLSRLQRDGRLVAAGPLPDEPGSGMTIIRDVHEDEAMHLAHEEDLSVKDGLFRVRVRPWTVLLTAPELGRPFRP